MILTRSFYPLGLSLHIYKLEEKTASLEIYCEGPSTHAHTLLLGRELLGRYSQQQFNNSYVALVPHALRRLYVYSLNTCPNTSLEMNVSDRRGERYHAPSVPQLFLFTTVRAQSSSRLQLCPVAGRPDAAIDGGLSS